MVLDFYEATSAFTLVTTRIFAHPAKRNFVDGLQKTTFPSPPAIQATWLPAFTMTGLSPARIHCPLLGTPIFKVRPQELPRTLENSEIELNVLTGQCLSRRIDDIEIVRKEAAAWQKFRNNKLVLDIDRGNAKVNWQFTTENARIKLSRLYPTLES